MARPQRAPRAQRGDTDFTDLHGLGGIQSAYVFSPGTFHDASICERALCLSTAYFVRGAVARLVEVTGEREGRGFTIDDLQFGNGGWRGGLQNDY